MKIKMKAQISYFLLFLTLLPLKAQEIAPDNGEAPAVKEKPAPLQTLPNGPPQDEPLPANIDLFSVNTVSPKNKHVPFYVRIPAGYDAKNPSGPYRVLFMCPYYNHEGLLTITGHEVNQELLDLADERKWFVVTPTFKSINAHDRDTCYYYPEKFSGKAVLEALDQIAKKYPVDINHIFVQGLSGGAQFCHRFTLWSPDRVVAAAINSCSWFDEPTPACNQVSWLVTIGDSDPSYENTLDFIGKLQDRGATPLFRSFLGMVHEGSAHAVHLDAAFFKFYDDKTRDQLGKTKDVFQDSPPLAMPAREMPYVGDSQTWAYIPNQGEQINLIAEDSRVYLPSKELADIWGTPRK